MICPHCKEELPLQFCEPDEVFDCENCDASLRLDTAHPYSVDPLEGTPELILAGD